MGEKEFWNSTQIVDYFADKPADPRISTFLEKYPITPGMTALDLGCGGGRHSELLARMGFQVSAIDVNPSMLHATEKRLSNMAYPVDIKHGSITNIPYPDESFDIVITTGVLHQAKSTDEYLQAISELSRVTKKGSIVLLNIFTNAIWDSTYKSIPDSPYSVITSEGLPMTLLPKDKFQEYMLTHHFKLIDEQGEDIKEENTGPRAVYRAFFSKTE